MPKSEEKNNFSENIKIKSAHVVCCLSLEALTLCSSLIVETTSLFQTHNWQGDE